MDRRTLESAPTRITNLRGLLAIPGGAIFMAIGLGNIGWGPFAHDWFFVLVLLALVASFALINRYYDQRYGRARLSFAGELRNLALTAVFFGAGFIGGLLLDSAVDSSVSLFAIIFAVAMFGWYAVAVGLRLHHTLIWGALLVIGLIPMWGGLDDKVSIAWLPIGLAAIATGIGDHLTLARTYRLADDA